MIWSWGAVHAPKEGLAESSYEDAFEIGLDDAPTTTFRAAISDGATESAFAQLWARMLAREFVRSRSWERQLDELAQGWAADVWSRDLSWNVQAKASEGAHATLLGVVVRQVHDRQWRASITAIGDSCAFVVTRDGVVRRAVPYENPEEFDQRPYLLSTDPVHRARGLLHRQRHWMLLDADERLVLSTDAVARWLLIVPPAEVVTLVDLAASSDRGRFDEWLARERVSRRMKDDDSTAVVIARG